MEIDRHESDLDADVVRAQVWASPTPTNATSVVIPLTSPGEYTFPVAPLPRSPQSLNPQHFKPPVSSKAQAKPPPATIVLTPLDNPNTFTGVRDEAELPFPSCPSTLSPQHWTPCDAFNAQVNPFPAVIPITDPLNPFTTIGTD